MSGHGHVYPNKDGSVARCGGPAICHECAIESAQAQRELSRPSDGKHAPRYFTNKSQALEPRGTHSYLGFTQHKEDLSEESIEYVSRSELEDARAELELAQEMWRRWEGSARKTGEAIIKMQAKLASQEESLRRMRGVIKLAEDRGLDWDLMHTESSMRFLQKWRGECFELLAAEQADGATSAEPKGEEKIVSMDSEAHEAWLLAHEERG